MSRRSLLAVLGFLAPAMAASAPSEAPGPFLEMPRSPGAEMVHVNGKSGKLYFVEMTSPGVALFDFDNDGDLDLYLPQGHPLGPKASRGAARGQLFRNDSTRTPRATMAFREVTEESGIRANGYGMGVATGDFDNDGDIDLYLTNWGANQLWRNDGSGRFSDVSATAGVADPGWGTSAAFLDFDHDGWLDLYVANYVRYSYDRHKQCYAPDSSADYCGPLAYQPEADRLFRNRGDGTFVGVPLGSTATPTPAAPGLGVVTGDFNGDGWVDIYVANDQHENHLWINQAGKGFLDEAVWAGVAVNAAGQAEASMGVDAEDFDGDGDLDIFLTHLRGETNTLYLNDGSGNFVDHTASLGLGQPSWSYTGFGTSWLDYDADGLLDLAVANGEVRLIRELVTQGDPHPLHQKNQLFHHRGRAGASPPRFAEQPEASGVLALSEVSRGLAVGDLDNDGDTDIVIANNGGPLRILLNQADPGTRRSWLGLRLLDRRGVRDHYTTRVEVELTDGRHLWRRVQSDGSYCSASDPRVLFNLPDNVRIRRLRVHWPGAAVEDFETPPLQTYTTLRQGAGTVGKRP